MRDDGAATTTYGLWLRLRDAADTTTLAVTTAAWDFDVNQGGGMGYVILGVG